MSRSPRDKQARAMVAVEQGSLASDGTLLGATVGAGLLAGLFWLTKSRSYAAWPTSPTTPMSPRSERSIAGSRTHGSCLSSWAPARSPWRRGRSTGGGSHRLPRSSRPQRSSTRSSSPSRWPATSPSTTPSTRAAPLRCSKGDARSQFQAPWNRLNLVRAVAAAGSFGALALAICGLARAAE